MPTVPELTKIQPWEASSDEKAEVNSILVSEKQIEKLEKAASVFSDSEGDESDENFLPFKKYTGTTCRKKSKLRYKQKLKMIKPTLNENSDEEIKIQDNDEVLNWNGNIETIIAEKALPEWVSILQQKKLQELFNNVSTSTKQRCDAVWKKILRDARKFYRLLYSYYLANWQKNMTVRNKDQAVYAEKLIAALCEFLQEIGLQKYSSTHFSQLARYFINDRHTKSLVLSAYAKKNIEDEKSLSEEVEEGIFKNFSERKLKVYINDALFALLLNSLFSKYSDVYKKHMHPKSRKKICCCVNILIAKSK